MEKQIQIVRSLVRFIVLSSCVCACTGTPSSNLVVNGSAEISKYDTVPKGWENIKGHWTSLEGDSLRHDYGYAQQGGYYFFAGAGLEGILQQDVDVSAYAKGIDANNQKFFLTAQVQSLDQGMPSDKARLAVDALDQTKKNVLHHFSTDTIMSISKWMTIGDTFVAPAQTRFIRVQLISERFVGGDNDGYFDNIVLTTISPNRLGVIILIIVVIIIVAGALIYLRKRTTDKKIA